MVIKLKSDFARIFYGFCAYFLWMLLRYFFSVKLKKRKKIVVVYARLFMELWNRPAV